MGRRSAVLPPPRRSGFQCSRGLQKAAVYGVVAMIGLIYLASSTNVWSGAASVPLLGRGVTSQRDLDLLREVAEGDGHDLVAMIDNMSNTLNAQAAAAAAAAQATAPPVVIAPPEQQAPQQQQAVLQPNTDTQLNEVPPAPASNAQTSASSSTSGDDYDSTSYSPATSSSTTTTSSSSVSTTTGSTDCPAGQVYSPHCRACFPAPSSVAPPVKVNFLHVPKSAGSAFTISLRRLAQCGPRGKGCWGDPMVTVEGNINCDGRFTGCYGHNGWAPDANKMGVGLFRHPVGRVRSAFYHDRHMDGATPEERAAVKQTQTMEEFIRFPGVRNCQTKMLLGFRCGTRKRIDDSLLQQAKQALDNIDFIGITEHYNTSVCLLMKMVGTLPEEDDFQVRRTNPQYDHSAPVPPATRDVIMAEDYYDTHIYHHALKLFKKRVADAGLELLEPPSQYENVPLAAAPPTIT